jgi:predicted metal-dependent enzyme (double-stranded beta helix superfamily)
MEPRTTTPDILPVERASARRVLSHWLWHIPRDAEFRTLQRLWAAQSCRRFLRLPATAGFEAWFIGWPGGSVAPLHDHGSASGVAGVLSGRLVESFHRPGLDGWQRREWCAGQRLELASGVCHEVRNADPRVAYTVHVYTPRLERMTFYDRTAEGGMQPVRVEHANQW